MNTSARSCYVELFERLYQEAPDPWHFATSSYEWSRYAAILAALARPNYDAAFEPGCSVGELTAALATRCEHVMATDISPTAVARARARCEHWPHVEIACADLALGPPAGPFDLVVFSEIGYYFDEATLIALANRIADQLQAGGQFLAVHWLGHSADHVLHGDTVHEALKKSLPLHWCSGERHAGFRIDCWVHA